MWVGSPIVRSLSSAPPRVSNPLLGVDMATTATDGVAQLKASTATVDIKSMPVSPKKLRLVANLARGLYWREAMLQLEFCRKGISVFVKNGINEAAKKAEDSGLDSTRLIVAVASVGKGTYRKELDYKSKGRAGIKKHYRAHLHIELKEVSLEEVQRTRFYGRWRASTKIMATPWHERVRELPRYKSIPGYEPGESRGREMLALIDSPTRSGRRSKKPHGHTGAANGKSVIKPDSIQSKDC